LAGSPADGTQWIVVNPPQGFHLTVTRLQNMGGGLGPVRHLVLSDGLVSVSVFIEPKGPASQTAKGSDLPEAAERAPQLARMGSALAYSTESHEHRITAVGEVPVNTLRAIASSVQRDATGDVVQSDANPANSAIPKAR
jgi:sigma-E factor negative regulatory protein RseB